ncbi:glycosyltransferase family 4 protein [Alteromonas flava]|uniref:glycosyltransferase family 4 protein n=1 Tax=Alteromonas flava TaxID=2048003 RepID=UPI0013DCD256|nr:glycosyltransferase family 4 protein [Alteromonas flava]
MKIGFVCNEYPPYTCGGIGTFTRELAERLVAQGHEVTVFGVYADVTSPLCESLQGVTVYRLPATSGWLGLWRNRRTLYHAIKAAADKGEIEVVEVPDFEGYATFWGALPISVLVRLHGTVTYFNHELNKPHSRVIKWLEQKTLARADRLLSVSQYAAEKTLNIFALDKPFTVIHNGIAWPDASACKQDYSYSGLVVFTGTLMAKKGVFALAQAWPEVQAIFPDARLVLIGKDTQDEGQSAWQRIEQLAGAQARITHTGHIAKAELQTHLVNADIAIFPSFSESFGLGPVEAMALAVPTIYTQLSCGPEIITHERDGILINPAQPSTISQAIIKLLFDQGKRKHFGAAGRQHAAIFSVAAQIAHNEQAYQQSIEANSV